MLPHIFFCKLELCELPLGGVPIARPDLTSNGEALEDKGTRCKVHSARYTVQGTQCKVHSARYTVQGTQCKVHSARYTVQGTRCEIHGARYTVQGTFCVGHSPLSKQSTLRISSGTLPPARNTYARGCEHPETDVDQLYENIKRLADTDTVRGPGFRTLCCPSMRCHKACLQRSLRGWPPLHL